MVNKLSERQESILTFIKDFLDEHSYPPTVRDIQTGCNISSTSVVDYNLRILQRDGYLKRETEVSRGIELLGSNKPRVHDFVTVPVLSNIAAGEPLSVNTQENWNHENTETVDLPITGTDGVTQNVQRISICKLLQERAEDLALLIKLKTREMGYEEPNEASLVLTGGASNLDGLTKIVASLTTPKVRLGIPTELVNIPEEFFHPSKATSLGILLWAADSFETIGGPEKSIPQKLANLYFSKLNLILKFLNIK